MDTLNTNKDTMKQKKEVDSGVMTVEKNDEVGRTSSQVVNDGALTSDELLEERLEKQLDTMSLGSVTSASSSILNTPNRLSGQQVQEAGDNKLGQGEVQQEKARPLRMSESQLKRFNWLLGRGHTLESAHELSRFPLEAGGLQKRQRSDDHQSPNTSGQAGPLSKKSKGSQKPGPGVSYQEMAEAIPIAVLSEDYPETRLSTEQLTAVKEALLTTIGELVNPAVRPNFRSCDYKQGYLQLACGDAGTASWLKEVITSVKPWEGATLKAIEIAELPKVHLFMGYFYDSCNDPTRRILQLTENQNAGISTKSWRVVTRKAAAKTVEMLLEVDDKSANIIIANDSDLNYKFGKARLRKVTGGASTAKRGTSVAQSSKSAKGEKVQLKGKKEGTQNPTAKAPEKPIPQKAKKQKPNTSSTNAAPGTGRSSTTGTENQPPGSSNSQKSLNGIGGKPANQRSRDLGIVSEDLGPSNIGVTAVGDRQPTLESSGPRAKDGNSSGQ